MAESEKPDPRKYPEVASGALGALGGQAIDPWAHRSVGMRCKTCMWFASKGPTIGRCRRHAPTMGGYPVVFVTDWCGDHKLNEASVS